MGKFQVLGTECSTCVGRPLAECQVIVLSSWVPSAVILKYEQAPQRSSTQRNKVQLLVGK